MRHLRVAMALSAALVASHLAAGRVAPAVATTDQAVSPPYRDQALIPQLPVGFSDSVVAAVPAPTALTWTPDGRMVMTSKPGQVVVLGQDGTLTTALDISGQVCSDTERGLVGVAVDPDFEVNHFLYLYYTHRVNGSCGEVPPFPANRVSRFVLGDDDTAAPGSEKVLVDHIVSPRGHHIAGDLEFGEDENLYITVGDGTCSLTHPTSCGPTDDNSQRSHLPLGKILWVSRDGRPAPDNPYTKVPGARRCTRPAGVPSGTGPCQEIFASGFRNPFRFARKPGTNRFYVNDVGMNTWEEVDLLRKGANYGWNVREGHCRRGSTTDCGPAGRFTNPIHDYRHGDCRSITGGAFVPSGVWQGWAGSYLYSDFACGKLFRLREKAGGGFERTTFVSGASGPVHLRFGPYGDQTALYYLSYFTGTVHRITRSLPNSAPVADFSYRPDGLTVSFSGAASYDPDAGDGVRRWAWDFGDGTTATTTSPTTVHTYSENGPVEVSLTVSDSHELASAPATRTVHAGEHPPTLAIADPGPDARFAVGQPVRLTAQASDVEDGALPGSAISWTVRLQHGNHFHPHLGPVSGGSVTTAYPAPEDLFAARTSRLVAVATARDTHGLTTSVSRALLPKTVGLTFRTVPSRGRLNIAGDRRPTPLSVLSWVGYTFPVRAPDQSFDGVPHVFARWSDNGARRHDVVTPAAPTELVARFRRR
jgi:glucose/arabinose dehydrogenase/PKD repeat protein